MKVDFCITIVRTHVGAGTAACPPLRLGREIRAQIEKALAAGVRVSHIDGHKHVHVLPQVFHTVCRIATGLWNHGRAFDDREDAETLFLAQAKQPAQHVKF